MTTINPSLALGMQRELEDLFKRYGVSVAVGRTAAGVAIRSQDEAVDARNVGEVSAQ